MTAPAPVPVRRPAPAHTGSVATRVLGVASLVCLGLLVAFGLFISPPAADLLETVRILYMHVPTVSVAYLMFITNAVASVVYLRKRTEFWDLLAASAAEIGVLFFALTIINGALWGRITWGVYWRWEPRLTTTALLMLMYIGYLVVRSLPAEPRTRGTRSAAIAIFSVLLIPIVHKAVDWWQGLHQGQTVLGTIDPKMSGTQLFSTYFGLLTFVVVAVWLLIHRFRVAYLEERVADAEMDASLAERRAEAPGAAVAAPPADPTTPDVTEEAGR